MYAHVCFMTWKGSLSLWFRSEVLVQWIIRFLPLGMCSLVCRDAVMFWRNLLSPSTFKMADCIYQTTECLTLETCVLIFSVEYSKKVIFVLMLPKLYWWNLRVELDDLDYHFQWKSDFCARKNLCPLSHLNKSETRKWKLHFKYLQNKKNCGRWEYSGPYQLFCFYCLFFAGWNL
jgi:hypothetical protein